MPLLPPDPRTDNTVRNQRRLPDPELCRTGYLGKSLDLWKCLVESPEACEYAFRFSNGIICHHPDRRNFRKTPSLTGQMNSQTEPASETARPLGQNPSRSIEKRRVARDGLSRETRQKISASVKKRLARRGGMSSEHRQKISASVKKWWAARGSMAGKRVQRISTSVKKRRAKRRRI